MYDDDVEHRGVGENGFTLVELLVVILILGLLAALALPAYTKQQDKAKDTDAKANARHMLSAVEACGTTDQSYTDCSSPVVGTDLPEGGGRGQVEAIIQGGGTGYVITARSLSGGNFYVTRVDRTTRAVRTCDDGGAGRTAGCHAPNAEGDQW